MILLNGVEEIESSAFQCCEKIKYITLPSSIKKIGDSAFDCHSNGRLYSSINQYSKFRVIALPRGIKKIGENAFGKFSEELRPIFFVPKNSFAENYVKEQGFEYRDYDGSEGFLCTENIYDGKLLYHAETVKSANIEQSIKVISACAFSGHAEIEEVVFPDSLEEIQENAFEGCTSLKKVKFNRKIKKIGNKAFYDANLQFVELPDSIRELSPDAFNEKCVVSVGGEMPGYTEKLAEFKEKHIEIAKSKETLEKLKEEVSALEEQIKVHDESVPDWVDAIPALQQSKKEIDEKITQKSIEKDERINALNAQLSQINSEIDRLIAERKHCFFLAISRKKELDNSIATEKEKELTAKTEVENVLSAYFADSDNLNKQIKSIDKTLRDHEISKQSWKDKGRNLKCSLEALNGKIKDLSKKIVDDEKKLAEENEKFSTSHEQWAKNLKRVKKRVEEVEKRAEEAERIRVLESQKANILSKLNVPKKADNAIRFDDSASFVDETLINAVYHSVIVNQAERDYAAKYNGFIDAHSDEIEKIQEINLLLNKNKEDQVEHLIKIEEPEPVTAVLPERFIKLNGYFEGDETWKDLKTAAKLFSSKGSAEKNFCDAFFKETDYLRFENLLMFPYCVIIYEPQEIMKVFTYDKLKVSVIHEEKEHVGQNVPKNGEFISEHYKHVNIDGSPSRRYKDNPLIKVIRYTSVLFVCDKRYTITIPVKAYNTAIDFSSEYDRFAQGLLKGSKKAIYKYIIASNELDVIDAKMQAFLLAEQKRKLRVIKEAEEEEKRIREERIAAEKAAEQKRQDIIKRQREINEERKRQAEAQKEKEKQIAKLFDDDFIELTEKSMPNDKTIAEEIISSKLPVEIIGNRLISNTVFKIEMCVTEKLADNSLTVYFVDEQGNVISNRKRVDAGVVGDSIKLGFVLNSGIDYSAMRLCFIQFESQNETIGHLDYKMNISFSPDVF